MCQKPSSSELADVCALLHPSDVFLQLSSRFNVTTYFRISTRIRVTIVSSLVPPKRSRKHITSLCFASNSGRTDELKGYLRLVSSFPNLRHLLWLQYEIEDEEMKHLLSIPTLESLRLRGNGIGAQGTKQLAKRLAFVPNLQRLDLGSFTTFTKTPKKERMRHLAKGLPSIPNLRYLILCNYSIEDKEAHILARSLPLFPHLEYLDLSENYITAEGGKHLAKGLTSLPNIRYLDIRGNSSRGIGKEATQRQYRQQFKHIPNLYF